VPSDQRDGVTQIGPNEDDFRQLTVHNLICSTSSCVGRSFVRSESLVMRGLSCVDSPAPPSPGRARARRRWRSDDSGGAERVAADRHRDTGRRGAAADQPPGQALRMRALDVRK
jgi:hypothetical protein